LPFKIFVTTLCAGGEKIHNSLQGGYDYETSIEIRHRKARDVNEQKNYSVVWKSSIHKTKVIFHVEMLTFGANFAHN